MKIRHLFISLALTTAMTTVHADSLKSISVINLDIAKKIAAGCESKAKENGWNMSVTVVDAGADMVYFQKMDSAYLGSIDISKLKAENAAQMQMPTSLIEELSYGKDKKGGPAPGLAMLPGFVSMAGGLPIVGKNNFLGAIGVSGGMPDQDELCAKAGLEAIAPLLK